MKSIKLGKISMPLDDYASQGNAILGIRDSGKSYTATAIAEQLMDAGIPIIAFDPIGIWRYLRVPGAGKGYEVIVAGGKQGDLPLTARGAQEIVRAAIRANVSLVIDLYDIHLSKADWREIVGSCIRTLLYENGEHGPRHIFIEEAAEFCPQVVSSDQGKVYAEVEKLARMGGNASLGYTLINQRAEQINKAVLELCDCMILHRQKGRNSITALSKWLDIATANKGGDLIKSLPGLVQGECWVWPAGADTATRTNIPAKRSLHPDRRMKQAAPKNETKVDVSAFVESMKGGLEAITREAEANDPKLLKARVAELERRARMEKPSASMEGALTQAQVNQQIALAVHDAQVQIGKANRECDRLRGLLASVEKLAVSAATGQPAEKPAIASPAKIAPIPARLPSPAVRLAPAERVEGIDGPQQRILNAIAWWESTGMPSPYSKTQIAFIAGYTPNSGAFNNPIGKLRSTGLVEYPSGGMVAFTDTGRASAEAVTAPANSDELHARVFEKLDGPQQRILSVLIACYPDAMPKDELAKHAGYTPNSGAFNNPVGSLRTLGLIDYPRPGHAVALPVLFIGDKP